MTGLAELEKEKYKSLGIEKKNDNKNRHISYSVRRPVKMHFNIKKHEVHHACRVFKMNMLVLS